MKDVLYMLKERDCSRKKQAREMGRICYVKNYELHPKDSAMLLSYFRKTRDANKCVLKGITITVEC